MRRKLTDKQERFCHEYMIDLNATQAAIRAGYSKKTAGHKASALVVNSCIKKKIKELQGGLKESSGVTSQMVIDELKKVGFANIQDYIG